MRVGRAHRDAWLCEFFRTDTGRDTIVGVHAVAGTTTAPTGATAAGTIAPAGT